MDALYDEGTDSLKDFVLAFREIMRIYNKIRVYDKFEFENFPSLPATEMESYRSKYFDAYREITSDNKEKVNVSVLDDIDFEIELLETDKIDVQYILNLIKTINLDSNKTRQADTNKIKRLLQNADSEELKSKVDLLEAFLNDIIPELDTQSNVSNALNDYLQKKRNEEVYNFSEEVNLPASVVNEQMAQYTFYGHTDSENLTQALNNAGYNFKQKISVKKKVQIFVQKTIKRFAVSQ